MALYARCPKVSAGNSGVLVKLTQFLNIISYPRSPTDKAGILGAVIRFVHPSNIEIQLLVFISVAQIFKSFAFINPVLFANKDLNASDAIVPVVPKLSPSIKDLIFPFTLNVPVKRIAPILSGS